MRQLAFSAMGALGLMFATAIGPVAAQRLPLPIQPRHSPRESGMESARGGGEGGAEEGLPATLQASTLAGLDWLQGEPVEEFLPGRLYLVEVWATVSEAAVERIALLNELNRRLGPQGLVIIGVAAGERDREAVAHFVRDHEPRIEYPVADAGAEGPFLREWLGPCGVRRVPHAFLIRDGRLLLSVPANQIHDAMLEGQLNGSVPEAALAGDIRRRNAVEEDMDAAAAAFDAADQAGNVAGMREALAELSRLGFRELILERCRFLLDVHRRDEASALARIDAAVGRGDRMQLPYLFQFSMALTIRNRPLPVQRAVWERLEREVTAHLAEGGHNLNLLEGLSRLRWDLEDRQGAVAVAQQLAQEAQAQDRFPWAYRRFAEKVEEGQMPTRAELERRIRQEIEESGGGGS